MGRREQKNSDFTVDVLKVFKSDRVDDRNRIDLRVVRWKKGSTATLEKRRIWEKDGVERAYKQAGLTKEDIAFIVKHEKEIAGLLNEEKK